MGKEVTKLTAAKWFILWFIFLETVSLTLTYLGYMTSETTFQQAVDLLVLIAIYAKVAAIKSEDNNNA